jgi:hypothetical protein
MWLMNWLEPAMPFDEYDRLMDGLLALIAARTHLPLYNLREKSQRWYW